MLEGGRRIAYGARTLIEGGLQSLPKLTVPGAALIGDAAGFLNVPRIKGIHTSIKSAMLAAEALFPLLEESESVEAATTNPEALAYQNLFETSWLYRELHEVRNIRPSFQWGLWAAFAYTGLEQYVFKGRTPWTLKHRHSDHAVTRKAAACRPIEYPKPDGKLTFDRLSSVFLANLSHEENQPGHLTLRNAGSIGASLQAEVVVHADAATRARYAEVADELRLFFITSKLDLADLASVRAFAERLSNALGQARLERRTRRGDDSEVVLKVA